ncbi:hypothetical protein HCU01_42160 [Halomonas cupida]|uniref:Sulfotransferase family protein n=1 Tax=Halomonas cupida TaxID=44933 RepID=A0A1M7LVD5_9GAMM|nr:hypothetical protein [Halomonas cupida]GEN26267.1 hypothetical protein HCU01_42160 [Halomonas cupida]SHM82201.1 hypothetical protein SAMN05660971_03959 [Halomonas cupida]
MIIAHIGSWKTGTTAFQYALRKSKVELERNRIRFVDTREKWFSEEFLPLFRNFVKRYESNRNYAESLEGSIDVFERKVGFEDDLIISWEAALGNPLNPSRETLYHPEATATWFSALNNIAEVKLSLVIRDQVELIQSMYAQEVRKGRYTGDFSEFLHDKMPLDVSWSRVVAPFFEAGLGDSLRVIPYSVSKGNMQNYFSKISWEKMKFSEIDISERKNRSFSKKAIEMMRRCSPLLEKSEARHFEKFLVENFSVDSMSGYAIASSEQVSFIRSHINKDDYNT